MNIIFHEVIETGNVVTLAGYREQTGDGVCTFSRHLRSRLEGANCEH